MQVNVIILQLIFVKCPNLQVKLIRGGSIFSAGSNNSL